MDTTHVTDTTMRRLFTQNATLIGRILPDTAAVEVGRQENGGFDSCISVKRETHLVLAQPSAGGGRRNRLLCVKNRPRPSILINYDGATAAWPSFAFAAAASVGFSNPTSPRKSSSSKHACDIGVPHPSMNW